jgi:hypothetical protein
MTAKTATSGSSAAAGAYGVSAGLDLLSGVFGFLASQEAASVAQSRGDLIRLEAEANAQRYAEQAAQFKAHEKVMYLSSGVKLSGSPVDALATTARIAHENIEAIKMEGDTKALDQDVLASNIESQGRAALAGGFSRAAGMGIASYAASKGAGGEDGLLALAALTGRR